MNVFEIKVFDSTLIRVVIIAAKNLKEAREIAAEKADQRFVRLYLRTRDEARKMPGLSANYKKPRVLASYVVTRNDPE